MRKFVFVLLFTIVSVATFGQGDSLRRSRPLPVVHFADSSTHIYAVQDGDTMRLNLFRPEKAREDGASVVYLYGGAFINGDRNDHLTRRDVNALLRAGFTVAAIDYRKFLSTVDFEAVPKKQWLALLDTAIGVATADCVAAVAYLTEQQLVDTSRMVLVGTSAGAIAVLQLDYARVNELPIVDGLPKGWCPSAVVGYAGAVFDRYGSIVYNREPAPTAFFYGEQDRVVPYGCLSLFANHYAGSECLLGNFADNDFTYWGFRYLGHGHEVSAYIHRTMNEFVAFVDAALSGRRIHYHTDCAAAELKIRPASRYSLMGIMRSNDGFEGLFDEEE